MCGACLLRLEAPLRIYSAVASLWLGTGKLTVLVCEGGTLGAA